MLTSSKCISQLFADHSCISAVPVVITHCPPLVIDAHLHSTLIVIVASHQTNISISTVATGINCNECSYLTVGSFRPKSKVYLGISHQHPLSGLCNSWVQNYGNTLRDYPHHLYSQYCWCGLGQHQHQNEHCWSQLHLLVQCNSHENCWNLGAKLCSPLVEYPSCRHTTVASVLPQESSHTVPHSLFMQISTLPSLAMLPPASRSWPVVQGAVYVQNDLLTDDRSLCVCQS